MCQVLSSLHCCRGNMSRQTVAELKVEAAVPVLSFLLSMLYWSTICHWSGELQNGTASPHAIQMIHKQFLPPGHQNHEQLLHQAPTRWPSNAKNTITHRNTFFCNTFMSLLQFFLYWDFQWNCLWKKMLVHSLHSVICQSLYYYIFIIYYA